MCTVSIDTSTCRLSSQTSHLLKTFSFSFIAVYRFCSHGGNNTSLHSCLCYAITVILLLCTRALPKSYHNHSHSLEMSSDRLVLQLITNSL